MGIEQPTAEEQFRQDASHKEKLQGSLKGDKI